jgi:hypothetical protein
MGSMIHLPSASEEIYNMKALPARCPLPSNGVSSVGRSVRLKLHFSRTAHGDFAWYHRRFAREDAKLTCSRRRANSPEHVLCMIAQRKLRRWPLRPCPRAQASRQEPWITSSRSDLGTSQSSLASWSSTPRFHPLSGLFGPPGKRTYLMHTHRDIYIHLRSLSLSISPSSFLCWLQP